MWTRCRAVTGGGEASAAARAEVDRMLALVRHPPVLARSRPTRRAGPVWAPAGTTRLERSRSWALATSFLDALLWLRSHDPPTFSRHGLRLGDSSGETGRATGPGGFDVADRTFYGLRPGSWSSALLNVSACRGPGDSASLKGGRPRPPAGRPVT